MARCWSPEPGFPALLVLIAALLAAGAADAESARLQFARHGEPVATRDVASLERELGARIVRVLEPYEAGEVRFRVFDFASVLDAVYGESWRREEELLFTCRDGYQPTLPVQRVLAHSSWLAFARVDAESFTIQKLESGTRKTIELGPFYLVWENIEDEEVRREGDYGWPYQLVAVELIRARDRFPRMAPPADASREARAGFAAFRVHCSRCHAVNGEGGSVGADLNQPTNPVEYRDRAWLARWIDDPSRILPTARMPRLNPALADRERVIDDLLAYLDAMSRTKRARKGD